MTEEKDDSLWDALKPAKGWVWMKCMRVVVERSAVVWLITTHNTDNHPTMLDTRPPGIVGEITTPSVGTPQRALPCLDSLPWDLPTATVNSESVIQLAPPWSHPTHPTQMSMAAVVGPESQSCVLWWEPQVNWHCRLLLDSITNANRLWNSRL